MNGLRDSARAIVADLVRKRLWPIAVLLLVALVAVPLLLGASSSAPALPPGTGTVAGVPTQAASDAAAPQAVTAPSRERAGKVRDPFFDPPAKASGDEGASKPPAGSGAGERSTTAAPKPAGKSSDPKPSAAKPKPKPSPRPAAPPAAPAPAERPSAATGTYHVTAAQLAEGAATRPLARLTPLGDPATPAAVYLGVMNLGRPYAVFVLGRRTTSRGEATCAAETACRIIGLRPGDTQTITVHTADSRIAYTVHVSSVRRITTSAAQAGALRAGVHPAGRAALRATSRDAAVAAALRHLGYRLTTGLLFSKAADARERATG